MHIFCPECGKHIDVSLEELENQNGHLVCPQCLAEIDVDQNLFNGKDTTMPTNDENAATPSQQPPSLPTPPALPSTPPPVAMPQAEQPRAVTPPAQPPHIDDVMRYCKHCGAFLKEGVNFCPKCGKYVRVTAPPPKPSLTPAQQQAARLRAGTTPARQVLQNKQSTYKPPQQSTYQSPTVKQQRTSYSARNSRNSSKGSKPSKFSILSLGGCLTVTIVAVALFFIIYIIIGVTYE